MKKFLTRHWICRFLDNCHMAQEAEDVTDYEWEGFEKIRDIILRMELKRKGLDE